jgi:hypothetical protein
MTATTPKIEKIGDGIYVTEDRSVSIRRTGRGQSTVWVIEAVIFGKVREIGDAYTLEVAKRIVRNYFTD